MKLITRLITAIWVCAAVSGVTNALAADATADKLKAQLLNRIGPDVKHVVKAAVPGWYEVKLGPQLAYIDEKGRYLFVGDVLDLKNNKNLTLERLAELNQIDFSRLPLEQAVKVVKGNGGDAKRKIAVFSDPNCPYCKKLEKTLAQFNNVTIYTFLYPILSTDSLAKAQGIWCSANRSQAWQAWALNDQVPSSTVKCDTTALNKNLEFGRELNITSTPTVFFADGHRLLGAYSVEKLEAEMKSVK